MVARSILFLLLLILSACSCCCPQDKYGCCYQCDGRRPQVFEDKCLRNFYIDYNFDCAEEEYPCEDDPDSDSRDLTEEDFLPPPIQATTYKLQRGDVLKISVFEETDTTIEKCVIAPDGNLYYLVLKGFRAEGLTLPELKKELEERLSTFYLAPQVNIMPTFLAGLNYKVLGRVNKPGLYPLTMPTTLVGAIAQAGGLLVETISYEDSDEKTRASADLHRSFIIRDGKKLNIDLHELVYSAESKQNIFLRPNDYIFIHETVTQEVFLLGNVRAPKAVPYYEGITLLNLLSQGQGWETMARWDSPNMHAVVVLRGKLCDPCYMIVDVPEILKGCALDVVLCPGDIVYIPNKPFRLVRELVRLAAESFIYGFAANAGSFYSEQRWFPPPTENSTNGQ